MNTSNTDSGSLGLTSKCDPSGADTGAPVAPPPTTDAYVAVGSTRFSDGAIQTAESLADAQLRWTVTGPDGRQWTGDSPLRACSAAQRDTIDPVLAMQRITAAVAEEQALHDAELAAAYAEGRKAAVTVSEEMVTRFLCWKLPKGFGPDCGISFDGRMPDAMGYERQWPVGTNLLTAEQARAMLECVLGATIPANTDPT